MQPLLLSRVLLKRHRRPDVQTEIVGGIDFEIGDQQLVAFIGNLGFGKSLTGMFYPLSGL